MGYEKCLTSFNEATGLDLTKEENEKILQAMIRAKNRIVEKRMAPNDEAMAAAATQMKEEKLLAAKKSQLKVMRNAYKRNMRMQTIESNGGISKAIETLNGMLRGTNKLGKELSFDSRNSVEANMRAHQMQWSNAVEGKLKAAQLHDVARSGALDKDIADAWWKLNNKQDAGTGPAAKIAKIYQEALDEVRDRLNGAGADIGDATNYVAKTEHDVERLRRAAGSGASLHDAFEAWWKKTEPRLDERTFNDVFQKPGQDLGNARKEFGRNVYDGLLTGVHKTVDDGSGTGLPSDYEGTKNIAKAAGAHRALFWKDVASWHGQMKDFGTSPNLYASVMNSLDFGGRSLALMDKFGDNPAGNLNLLIRRIRETYSGDADALRKFDNKIHYITDQMSDLDGSQYIPQHMGLEKFTAGVLSAERAATAGGFGATHVLAGPLTQPSEMAHHGIGRFKAMGALMHSLVTGMGNEEKRQFYAQIGALGDSGLRYAKGRIGSESTVPGALSSMADKVVSAGGLHFFLQRIQASAKGLVAHNLADNLSKPWQELHPYLSDMLGRYGITPEHWELLREMKDRLPSENGNKYLSPASIMNGLDPTATEAHLRSQGIIGDKEEDIITHATGDKSYNPGQTGDAREAVYNLKQDLSDKIMSYYTDAGAHSTVTPGIRERAALLQGTQSGTVANTALRFFTQFKMWPLAAYNQMLEREIYTSLSGKKAAWNIGIMIAMGMPMGYLRLAANDMASGHAPRDPRDPSTLLESFAKSGIAGVAGDFLFGETNRMSNLSGLAGPVGSDAEKLYHMFAETKADALSNQGKMSTVWKQLVHFGVGHIPFANLIYLKGALDYMLWYHMYEATDPGWWERTNQRLEKEKGQTMTGYTPGGGVPRGVPGVYLQNNEGSSGLLGHGLN